MAFANLSPLSTATCDSAEPSVGSRMCLYIGPPSSKVGPVPGYQYRASLGNRKRMAWLCAADDAGLRHARTDVDVLGAGTAGDHDVDLLGAAGTPYGFGIAPPRRALRRGEALGKVADGQPRHLPQALLDIALGEACLVERARVVDSEQQQDAVPAAVHGRHVGRDLAQDFLRADAFAARDVAEVGSLEHGDGAFPARESTVHVERRPGVLFLVLAADVGIAQRRAEAHLGIDSGQRAPDVVHDQADRAADGRVGAPSRPEAAGAAVDVE